jgi:hypothetical protein
MKHYFNDKHEDKTNILYRNDFIKRYFGYERHCFRWIQIKKEEAADMKVHKDYGYSYTTDEGKDMAEYHGVDDCKELFQRAQELFDFGGALSIQWLEDKERDQSEKPFIIFGQDEVIFKQYLLTLKHWIGREEDRPLVPKDEGQGVMLSVFQSRERGFGFGFGELTAEELALVNCCRNGQHYRDEAAAKLINLTPAKPDLKDNPFYVKFEYGVSKEGFWTYDRMVLQLEDCIDVLQGLHPQYDYVFLFDHLCGHDRQRPDSLNHHTLNKGFRGGQTKMRSSKILRAASFLGQYEHPQKLKVGDNQQLVFLTSDQEGPFYLSTEQRAAKMNDKSRESENRTKVKSKTELLDELALKGVCPEDPKVKRSKKQEVLELAAHNDLKNWPPIMIFKQTSNSGTT